MNASSQRRIVVISGPSGPARRRWSSGCSSAARGWWPAFRPRPGRRGPASRTGSTITSCRPTSSSGGARRASSSNVSRFSGGDTGTARSWSEVTPSLEAGKWVVLEIDVQGPWPSWQRYPNAITIFVGPGRSSELERRLRSRGTETAKPIAAAAGSCPARIGLCRPLSLPSGQRRRGPSRPARFAIF